MVTSEVKKTWASQIEKVAKPFDLASKFGTEVVVKNEATAEMALMLRTMAKNLDELHEMCTAVNDRNKALTKAGKNLRAKLTLMDFGLLLIYGTGCVWVADILR